MNKSGEIIVIEDDIDDQEVLSEIFATLGYDNKVKYFTDGELALEYLTKCDVTPFLILSDVNMPKMTGYELRNKIFADKDLASKCVPYLFFTTVGTRKSVIDAYALSVQGFFVKPNSYHALTDTIRKIIEYWKECAAPNQYDC